MTFLDMVRELGALTRDRCHDECSLGLHRQEAARHLGCLLENPRLVHELAKKVAPTTTPAEHDALAPAHEISAAFLERGIWMPAPQVEEVISALRQLAADPGTRPAVLVALGLGGEGL